MARKTRKSPEFFEENPFDPVDAAIGDTQKPRSTDPRGAAPEKRKAGFYLSARILERFNRNFYELKLQGRPVENKSALLEAVIDFALDDIERAGESLILKRLQSSAL
ncbi:MAG: hypothetical protein WAM73_18280 [Desulfobacterales bacterium]